MVEIIQQYIREIITSSENRTLPGLAPSVVWTRCRFRRNRQHSYLRLIGSDNHWCGPNMRTRQIDGRGRHEQMQSDTAVSEWWKTVQRFRQTPRLSSGSVESAFNDGPRLTLGYYSRVRSSSAGCQADTAESAFFTGGRGQRLYLN